MNRGWIFNLFWASFMFLYFLAVLVLSRVSRLPERWRERLSEGANRLPTVLATLGILGTFIGIFWGLLGFDVKALQESIPGLLDGLKIAFFTSIVGLTLGFIAREIFSFVPPLEGEVEDPVLYLKRVEKGLSSMGKDMVKLKDVLIEKLDDIAHSLVGEGETTLITQIQKLRYSLLDKQDEMISEFRGFTQTMAKANVDTLIEALNEVIRDFDAKINEKLGVSPRKTDTSSFARSPPFSARGLRLNPGDRTSAQRRTIHNRFSLCCWRSYSMRSQKTPR